MWGCESICECARVSVCSHKCGELSWPSYEGAGSQHDCEVHSKQKRTQNAAVPVGADVNKSLIKINNNNNNNRLTNCEKSICKSPRKANAFKKHKKKSPNQTQANPKNNVRAVVWLTCIESWWKEEVGGSERSMESRQNAELFVASRARIYPQRTRRGINLNSFPIPTRLDW